MENKEITLDEVVMDFVCILELTHLFYCNENKNMYSYIYNQLKFYIRKFYSDTYLLNEDLLDELIEFINSAIKAHDDVVVNSLSKQLKLYVEAVKKDAYFQKK